LAILVIIPIESAFLRTLAHSYLSAATTPGKQAHISHSSYHIFSPWAGLDWLRGIGVGGIKGTVYLRRLAICAAVEMIGNLGLFEIGYLTVTWLGRNLYDWGKL
jgi:hypothetical protein